MSREPSLKITNLTAVQLMEIDGCTRCGECAEWCPTYAASALISEDGEKNPGLSPRDKIYRWKTFVDRSYGIRAQILGPKEIPEEEFDKFVEDVHGCTTCGICGTVCEAGINTVEELCNKTSEDMMKVRNLGRKSLEEVLAKLKELGLSLNDQEEA